MQDLHKKTPELTTGSAPSNNKPRQKSSEAISNEEDRLDLLLIVRRTY